MTPKEKQRELIIEIMKADEQSGIYPTMKQTAVDWLVDQVEDFIGLIPSDIIERAKQMEKEQIKDAYDHHRCIGNFENGKQYYKENYE